MYEVVVVACAHDEESGHSAICERSSLSPTLVPLCVQLHVTLLCHPLSLVVLTKEPCIICSEVSTNTSQGLRGDSEA